MASPKKQPKQKPEPSDPQAGAQTHTFLVYDAKSGEVVHGHKAVNLPFADAPSEEELESQALEMATEATDRGTAGLKVLEVSEKELEPGYVYSVDPKDGSLKRESADEDSPDQGSAKGA
jgi:hypothetical protein